MSDNDNVLDLTAHRRRKELEEGLSGWFIESDDLEGELLQKLGEPGGPCAIGLMAPLNERDIDYDNPEPCGWSLSPTEARALAQLLERYADECEKGYPE